MPGKKINTNKKNTTKKTNYSKILLSIRDEERVILNFLNMQSNMTNAVRYLVMKEVMENGYRNLGEFLPQFVTEKYFNYDFARMI